MKEIFQRSRIITLPSTTTTGSFTKAIISTGGVVASGYSYDSNSTLPFSPSLSEGRNSFQAVFTKDDRTAQFSSEMTLMDQSG